MLHSFPSSISVSLFLAPSLPLHLCLSFDLFTFSLNLSFSLSLSLFPSLSLPLSISLSLFLSLSSSLSHYLSISLSMYLRHAPCRWNWSSRPLRCVETYSHSSFIWYVRTVDSMNRAMPYHSIL